MPFSANVMNEHYLIISEFYTCMGFPITLKIDKLKYRLLQKLFDISISDRQQYTESGLISQSSLMVSWESNNFWDLLPSQWLNINQTCDTSGALPPREDTVIKALKWINYCSVVHLKNILQFGHVNNEIFRKPLFKWANM